MASLAQQNALLDFLDDHPDLARGRIQKSKEGRAEAKRLWESCASILNAQDPTINKTAEKWRKYYVDLKTKLRSRVFEATSSRNATGGGPPRHLPLTQVQERLLSLLGRDLGEPAPGVRHNPLSQNIETQEIPPVVDAASTTAETDSESAVLMYCPIEPGEEMPASTLESAQAPEVFYAWMSESAPVEESAPVVESAPVMESAPVVESAPQSPALERPQTPAPSPQAEAPTPQPAADSSRRRRRQRRPRTPLPESVSELREAQARLEQLEAQAAAATRELAAATREGSNRIAAALESIATRGITIRVVMESPPRRRRRHLSSDEE